jgi:hypothetical protein
VSNEFDGLETWRIRPKRDLDGRPIRPGDLVFFHATRQYGNIDKREIESEAGEFLPGFYTTSGTNLDDILKLGWYWYECPSKTKAPKKDWRVLAFVLRRSHVESSLMGPFVRETNSFYLQAPREFASGADAATPEDVRAIEFANRHGSVMIYPDKPTPVQCGRGGRPYSLDDFVFNRNPELSTAMQSYAVIVGLQKPAPLDMRQQCWVAPDGVWHINHAERYLMFDRSNDSDNQFQRIWNFVTQHR